MSKDPHPRSMLTALNTEYELTEPELDELRQFRSLVILIRDQKDVGIRIEFKRFCAYRFTHESYSLDMTAPFADRYYRHWLYETQTSEFFRNFRQRNPHVNPNWRLRHFLILMSSDVIDVIGMDQPEVSLRTDDIKGWLRAEEADSF